MNSTTHNKTAHNTAAAKSAARDAAARARVTDNGALRVLENPSKRLPLPAHLIRSTPYSNETQLERAVNQGIMACGLKPHNVPRLTVAWPQKHAHSGHFNAATQHAHALQKTLADIFPKKEILMAQGLYETVRLNRSENSSMTHTVKNHQIFAIDPQLQDTPLPFFAANDAENECFVLTDWFISRGTTMAALAGFIQHNGGHVVAATTPQGEARLIPEPETRARLRTTFRQAASGLIHPDAAEALVEHALNRHGHSLQSLTDGEFYNLRDAVAYQGGGMASFLSQLDITPEELRRFTIDYLGRLDRAKQRGYIADNPAPQERRGTHRYDARPYNAYKPYS